MAIPELGATEVKYNFGKWTNRASNFYLGTQYALQFVDKAKSGLGKNGKVKRVW